MEIKNKYNMYIQIMLYIVSALMVTISMPPFYNIPILGFIALVPIILGLRLYQTKNRLIPVIFFGLIYTSICYSWYIDVFSSIWGYILIVAVAFWHTNLILRGIKSEKIFSKKMQIFILPIFYSSFEFLQRHIPFVKEWWFIAYPKTSWGFPEALWGLSIFGITGVTFIMIFSNNVIAKIIQNLLNKEKISNFLYLSVFMIILYLGFGFYYVDNSEIQQTYTVGVVSDMANDISGQSKEGLYVEDKDISEKILNINLGLSEKIARNSDFIVWSENEFFNYNDKEIINKLKKFSQDTDTILVVDSYINNKNLYDVATLIDSEGIKYYAKKKYLFSDEKKAGFISSDDEIETFNINDINVGLGVCYDYHFEDIIKTQAFNDAKLILMPRDDDMNKNKKFPYYHSTDAVFRAIENNVAVVSANTNGSSIIVDSNGKIKAYSKINEKGALNSQITIRNGKTIYTRYGNWFAILLILFFVVVLGKKFYIKHIKE